MDYWNVAGICVLGRSRDYVCQYLWDLDGICRNSSEKSVLGKIQNGGKSMGCKWAWPTSGDASWPKESRGGRILILRPTVRELSIDCPYRRLCEIWNYANDFANYGNCSTFESRHTAVSTCWGPILNISNIKCHSTQNAQDCMGLYGAASRLIHTYIPTKSCPGAV